MAYGWFRFYNDAVNDPKVQRLNPPLFKFWVNLLCLASANDGKIPSAHDISFAFRMPESETLECVSLLLNLGLLDDKKTGVEPHNWRKRQFKSDTSTDRVKRFRKRFRNVTETAPETEQNQNHKQTQESAPRFDEFWLVCPRKIGKEAAERAWAIAASGKDTEALIQAMRVFAGQSKETPVRYLPAPARWLSEKRWQDENVGGSMPLDPETAADVMDRADRLMRRGKYAEKYQ